MNLVFGRPSDFSEYLIPPPSVRLVAFTGSVPVGNVCPPSRART
jgi:succinate-semialdehyde dehydrogenase/glutarate-semialdehyde dehydrogenase